MKNLLFLLAFILPVSLIAQTPSQDLSTQLPVDKVITVNDVINLMRSKQMFVEYEEPFGFGGLAEWQKSVNVPKEGSLSVDELLKRIKDSTHLATQYNQGIISIFDQKAHANVKYALNVRIENIEIKNMFPNDTVALIAKQSGANIMVIGIDRINPGKPVTLSLKNITVHEALDKISKAAGLYGWSSFPSCIKGVPDEKQLVIITF